MTPHSLDPLISKWKPFFNHLPKPFFSVDLGILDIQWNPRMRSRAGLCKPAEKKVELNPHLLKEDSVLEEVFVHEVCHFAVSLRFPYSDPHGPKWKKLMELCGFKPERCHKLLPVKRHFQKRWEFSCGCRTHLVSTVTANRIKRGLKYRCNKCLNKLIEMA